MNRPIKFRAWEKTDTRMLDLSEIPHDAFNIVLFHDLILKGKKSLKTGGKKYEYEVMQFTGLLDKNGKEIYEGDILEYVVDGKTADGTPWANLIQKAIRDVVGFKDGTFTGYVGNSKEYIIIGNIFENSNLLA